MSTPIIDERCEIAGWTDQTPVIRSDRFHDETAERLVGPHYAVYVEITDAASAARAGAPPHWRRPWRCIGLCSRKLMTMQTATQTPLLRVYPMQAVAAASEAVDRR